MGKIPGSEPTVYLDVQGLAQGAFTYFLFWLSCSLEQV